MCNEKLGKITSFGDLSLNIEWAVLGKPPGEFWGGGGAPKTGVRWPMDRRWTNASYFYLLLVHFHLSIYTSPIYTVPNRNGPQHNFIHSRRSQSHNEPSQAWNKPYQAASSARRGGFCFSLWLHNCTCWRVARREGVSSSMHAEKQNLLNEVGIL